MNREEIIEKLNQRPSVSAPFIPPESYLPAIENTSIQEMQIETTQGQTRLWLIEAQERSDEATALVFFHGGGFISPHTQKDFCFCRKIAYDLGVLVVDVDYYTASQAIFPVACYQAYDCVKWVYDHSAELKIKKDKIITIGLSAGANLSIAVGMLAGERKEFKPTMQVLGYPPTDFSVDPADKPEAYETKLLPDLARQFTYLYLDDLENGKNVLASPNLASLEQLKGMPETVIVTAGHDNLRFEAEEFAAKLEAAGVPVHQKQFTNSGHGFIILACEEYEEAIAFMEKEIQKKHPYV